MTTHGTMEEGPARAKNVFVLTHGAGAPMDSDFMNDFATELAAKSVRVVRFEFPYMAERRTTGKRRPPNTAAKLMEVWWEVIAQIGKPDRLVIGGKSMGGRIASMIADEAGVRGLVCLGYPFHPPGQPEKLRTAHLASLRTEALIVQGERDAFGSRVEVGTFSLSKKIRFAWMSDGDHSFKPRVKSGHTLEKNLTAAVDAVSAFFADLTKSAG